MSYPCPDCGSTETNKASGRQPAGKQRRKCKDCDKSFTIVLDNTNVNEDTLDPMRTETENIREKPPAKGKAGPKKVLNEFGRNIADTAATVLADSTQVASGAREKGFTYQEAQSITHPGGRILWRHLPDTAKDLLPAIPGVDEEDLADVIEIGATIIKFAMRRFTIWYNDWRTRKLTKASPQAQRAVQNIPQPTIPDDFEENPPDPMAQSSRQQPVATASSNGHAAMVAMLPGDLGMVEG